jgi:hypothetical protein
MQLSSHFTLDELMFSQEAVRHGIDNTPPVEIVEALKRTCQQAEAVRALLGSSMLVSSGFRCRSLNSLIGGAPNSAHQFGWAMDFISPAFGKPIDICLKVADAKIKLDQCIQEGTWVHLSFAPTYRMQFLTAKFGPNGATYSDGLGAV